MGVNSLPKTVTRQRRNCDLNLGPSAPESSMLTGRLTKSKYRLVLQLTGNGEPTQMLLPSEVQWWRKKR